MDERKALPDHAGWIDNAKIAAIAAVVILHISTITLNESPATGASWWLSAWLTAASRWGVPIFVMLSGAALLGTERQEPAADFYRRRLARVLLPLLFWSAFYLLWSALPALLKGQPVDWPAKLARWGQGRPYYHLWFLYMLLGLYLITPWLRLAMRGMDLVQLRHAAGALMAIAAVDSLWRGLGWSHGQTFFLLWAAGYLPYFLLGAYAARRLVSTGMPNRAPVWAWVGSVAALLVLTTGHLVLLSTGQADAAAYWLDSQSLPVIALCVTLLPLLVAWRRPWLGPRWTPRLAWLTFGAYLVHPAVLDVLRLGRLQQQSWSWAAAALLLVLGTLLTLAVATLLTALLQRLPGLRRLV